ncbi:MAG: FISUMP domain-containing protein [Mangrovibacterium sp.]
MKKKLFPFVLSVLLLAVSFQSCQKDEIVETEDVTLKSAVAPVIYLVYPETDVAAGENFEITYSSSCGKIMLERAYVLEFDAVSETYNKVFVGLTCETENLQWESVGEDVFETCAGETVTENIEAPGTYVYRAKLNMKAIKKSGCLDCGDFVGNQYECFMITVVAGNQNEGSFTDERDGHEYKWVKIGEQIWMAENLAYNLAGSRAYNDDEAKAAIYGRLYTRDQATGGAAPAGWHLPSMAEWQTLIDYIANNAEYGNVAKALASKDLWQDYGVAGNPLPGSSPELNNSSGFNGLPAGFYFSAYAGYTAETNRTQWWSSDSGDIFNSLPNLVGLAFNVNYVFKDYGSPLDGFSIRCIKNAD